MADSAYVPELALQSSPEAAPRRHSAAVRITHWINTAAFLALLVSGAAVLLSHPRLYWGEAGNAGTPSLLDLPLPFVLENQNGWGRYLHFLAAWVCVLNGLFYVLSGLLGGHFRRTLWSATASHPRGRRFGTGEPGAYTATQRLAYSSVVFVLFPLAIWTGLAMSPAIASVFPALVEILGGQQSARTIHFFVAGALVLFLLVHVTMVSRAGFASHMRAMITGSSGKERA